MVGAGATANANDDVVVFLYDDRSNKSSSSMSSPFSVGRYPSSISDWLLAPGLMPAANGKLASSAVFSKLDGGAWICRRESPASRIASSLPASSTAVFLRAAAFIFTEASNSLRLTWPLPSVANSESSSSMLISLISPLS